MRVLIVDFENDFALKGIPFFRKELTQLEPTGLVARSVEPSVYTQFKNFPIFEKRVSQEFLVKFSADVKISTELLDFLAPYEDQIFYHINRNFETTLGYDYSLLRYKILLYILHVFKESKPELVYFGVTPHDPISYLIYLLAKFQKIRTPMISRWHLLSGYVIYDTIGELSAFVRSGSQGTDKNSSQLQSLLDSILNTEPYYMVAQKKTSGKALNKVKHSLFNKRRVTISGAKRYYSKLKKRSFYQSISDIGSFDELAQIDKKLIYIPFHYQPELTTSPEGGYFAQQWLMINWLYNSLDENYVLLVKEHPSQFMVNSKPVRSEIFYETLAAMGERVRLINLDIPSNQILNICHGVATITGTVGLESILREKPAFIFGDAKYSGVVGTYNYADDSKMAGFLEALEGKTVFTKDQVITDLKVLTNSRYFEMHEAEEPHKERHLRILKKLLCTYLNLDQ